MRNPNTFLYNTGPITSLDRESYNRPQTYTVVRIKDGKAEDISGTLPVPPCNVGPRSTPNYAALADAATKTVAGRKFFAGQRGDAFQVDLGSIFDLGALRPFQNLHLLPMAAMDGINSVQSYNVPHHRHPGARRASSPGTARTQDGIVLNRRNVIGVWATASRRTARVFNKATGKYGGTGPAVQVSRLGNPLFNEVIVPMAEKDKWNASEPKDDADYAKYVHKPELAGLLPVLYPDVFPNLAAYDKPRADLDAILLTGIPNGVVPGFQNYTGPGARPTCCGSTWRSRRRRHENKLGIVGGDLAGFPNGRRLGDDVVAIELKAVAGATIPLVDPSYTPDGAAALARGRHDRRQHRSGAARRVPVHAAPGWWVPDRPGHLHASDATCVTSRDRGPPARLAREPARGHRAGGPRHRRRRRGGHRRRCRSRWSARRSTSSPPTST